MTFLSGCVYLGLKLVNELTTGVTRRGERQEIRTVIRLRHHPLLPPSVELGEVLDD
jgi:hypothetical protein